MAVRQKITIENLLFEEIAFGADALERGLFYLETKDMTSEQLDAMKARVRSRLMDFFSNVERSGGPYKSFSPSHLKTSAMIDKALASWFREWTRLAGRMDVELDEIGYTVKNISDVCSRASKLPEYAPYLDRHLKGYVVNRCVDHYLDYMKVLPELRSAEEEKAFLSNHPYLCEQKEWDLLGVAYNLGRPAIVKLEQEPSLANGYIGAETSFSRFLTIVGGPLFPQGKVTGLGQIDYKDCTNAFVLFDSAKKCVGFYDLSSVQRKMVLECVHRKDLALKYDAREKSREKGRKGGLSV